MSHVTLALTVSQDITNIVEGDVHLLNGQVHFLTGLDATRQKCVMLLRFVKGEYFLNTEEGIPYFTHILIKNPNASVVRNLLRKALLASPGITAVPVLELDFDFAARSLAVRFEVLDDEGALIRSEDFGPFILEIPNS
jgi:hypothetical protein